MYSVFLGLCVTFMCVFYVWFGFSRAENQAEKSCALYGVLEANDVIFTCEVKK